MTVYQLVNELYKRLHETDLDGDIDVHIGISCEEITKVILVKEDNGSGFIQIY